MPDGLEARLRWLFGGVAVVLVATGALALLATSTSEPAQTSDGLTGFASRHGGPEGWSRHGLSLETWSRALVTAMLAAGATSIAALGARIVGEPRRSTHLMPVLACAGFAAFACGALEARHAWHAAATWMEAAIVAGGGLLVGIASILGWLALWLAARPGDATARRDAALFDALVETLVPPGEGLELDARDGAVRARIVTAFAARSTQRRPALRLALRTLDVLTLLRHRRRFDAADQELREHVVASLATWRRPRLRALGAALNEILAGAFWEDARVRAAVGEDTARVRALLEAGPNAAAHRARREAEEAAEIAAEAAAGRDPVAPVQESAASGATGPAGVVLHEVGMAAGVAVAAVVTAPAASAVGAAHAAAAVVAARAVVVEPAANVAPERGAGGEAVRDAPPRHGSDAASPVPGPAPGIAPPASEPRAEAAASQPASDGPTQIAPRTEELPFDRPWTLGVPAHEGAPSPPMGPVLRVARAGGPTRR